MHGYAARVRTAVLLNLVVLVPTGIYTKFYAGPLQHWVANSLGGVFYELFWCLAALAMVPRIDGRVTAGIVFGVTSLLEFLQLWHPAWLEAIRGTFLGAALLGSTFVWSDFAYYVVGSVLGWWAIASIKSECARTAA
ncbi:MAG: DUF2809 domain-containing protein [Chitinivibrionales bacterium]|nr:DUF2809 domain-containing protein [Chitinivibrionales bacterium]MBD3357075.1 DUF2809 domain-containing protein [Chitinivibrionales bacterium]